MLIENEPALSVAELAMRSKTFCIYPFTHVATKTDGSIKLCCRSWSMGDIRKQTLSEIWNGEDYRRVRRQFLNGERPKECEACWNLEDVGTRSMRERALHKKHSGSRLRRFSDQLKKANLDGTMPFEMKTIELKLSNFCNLRCRMCHPVDSTSWVKDWGKVEDLMAKYNEWSYNKAREFDVINKPHVSAFEGDESWWREFAEIVPHLEVIEFAGGEPLIDPLHYRLMDLLKPEAHHIDLKYSSNLTKLKFGSRDVIEDWKAFRSIMMYASMDGIHDVYDYIRTGSRFEKVIDNIRTLQQAPNLNLVELAVACTFQIYNIFQLPEIVRYFSDLGVKFHSHRVTYPRFLNCQTLPPQQKAYAVKRIEDCLAAIPSWSYSEEVKQNLEKQVLDNLNFLKAKSPDETAWTAFIDFTKRLDSSRNTEVGGVIPELREFFL